MNNPDFIDRKWYRERFFLSLGNRRFSFETGLCLLNQYSTNPLIVETGAARTHGDGRATVIFGAYASHHGGRVVTIDISKDGMDNCKELTKEFEKHITYAIEDSLVYLPTITEKIDFLYLDSMDCPPQDDADASVSQQHNLNEFLLAEKNLSDHAIIMIDDVAFVSGGKARKTHEYMISRGCYLLVFKDYQSVWLKV